MITSRTIALGIVKAVGILLAFSLLLLFIYKTQTVILYLVVSLIFALIANPIVEFLKQTKMGFLSMYSQILESGLKNGIFTKNPPIYLLHSTVSGTLFYAFNAKEMYKEFLNETEDEEAFDERYYTELNKHIKYLLKDLLGYEENK